MGFETVALSIVKDVVRHSRAGFTSGTMFVENIDKTEATRILDNLRGRFYAEVILSEIGDSEEFAFDFI